MANPIKNRPQHIPLPRARPPQAPGTQAGTPPASLPAAPGASNLGKDVFEHASTARNPSLTGTSPTPAAIGASTGVQ
jgi:hypothetical protein